MLGKIIDNKIEFAPNHIIENGVVISNPSKEKLIELGYREITQAEIDELNSVDEEVTVTVNAETALNNFASTLASTETNSIAKIRAAAQQFLKDTEATQ